MSLATELQDDIAELLDDPDVGRAITISGSTTITTRGLFLGYSDKLIDGAMIKQGDRRCFVKIKDVTYTPQATDEVTAGSDKYAVVSFRTIELGGTAIIYILQVRR